MLESYEIIVSPEEAGQRVDKFLSSAIPGLSRTRISSLIAGNCLRLDNGIMTDISLKVKTGQTFTLTIPPPVPSGILPADIPLDVVYEDELLLVLNKPAGLVVHPAVGHRDGTLVNALLHHCQNGLSGIGGVERPGLVHRLDKDTSGLLLVAKDDGTHTALSAQFAGHEVTKIYHTVVYGSFAPPRGTLTGAIARSRTNRQKMAVVDKGGKEAVTAYRTLEEYQDGVLSLVECTLHTGRTHQIRVHLSHAGHGIVGDRTYGGERKALRKTLPAAVTEAVASFPRQALHAYFLEFTHPKTGRRLSFTAPLPEDMQELIGILK